MTEGVKVTDEEAACTLRRGESVSDPNAGAGSYRKFAERVGIDEVHPIDTGSSAGDWIFLAQLAGEGRVWHVMYQHNRYPYCGFRYQLSTSTYHGELEDVLSRLGESDGGD